MSAHHPFSPSSLERLELCPGSHALSQGLEAKTEKIGEEGTLLHEYVPAGLNLDHLDEDQKELVKSCRAYFEQLKAWYPEVTAWSHEEPLKLVHAFEILSEGTADLVGEAPGYVVIADWKFGYKETTQAEENAQVRTYAAMKMGETHIPKAYLHIHHPRLKVSTYTNMEMAAYKEAVERVQRIRARALDTDAMQLNPSDKACEYCPAKALCPALKARSLALSTVHSSQLVDPELMAGLLTKAKMVKKWAESVEYHAKAMALKNGGLPGYKLRATKGRRSISDPQKAYDLVCGYFAPMDFMKHCEINIGSLEDAFVAAKRKSDERMTIVQAKSEFETLLLPVIARAQESQTLVAQ